MLHRVLIALFVNLFGMIVPNKAIAQWNIVFGPLAPTPIERIKGMSFVNDSVGYVVGYTELQGTNANYIMKTEDYANSWDTIFTYIHEPYPYAEFQDVFFIDENNGWVCGTNFGQIFKTVDGGENWVGYPLPKDVVLLYSIKFADVNYGISMSNSANNYGVQTFDGGVTWETDTWIDAYDCSFLDSCNFVLAGAGIVSHSTNCELNTQPFPTVNEFGDRNGRAVFMQDNDNWVLGSTGLIGFNNFASILTTHDAGQSFVINDLFFANWVRCFGFIDDQTGFVGVSGADDYACAVLKTSNGGLTWHCQETPIGSNSGNEFRYSFTDIECPSANYQYGMNASIICRTTNGGGPLGDTYTGVKVLGNKPKTIDLYPNPAASIIHLELSDAHEVKAIEIYNSVGQLVETNGASGINGHSTQPEIEVGHLAPGCYSVVVRYEKEIIRSRFVVE